MDTPKSSPSIKMAVEGITKSFPGVVALDEVSMEFHPGQVNAIIGENGAGKSTLLKILSGIYQPDSGTILLNGEKIIFNNTRDAQEKGIAIIHQELNLIPQLSITDNIFLGQELLNTLGFLDSSGMDIKAAALLEMVQLDVKPQTKVADLRVGQQQLVEVAKALSRKARILFLDEPTSAISDKETAQLFKIIDELKDQGVTLVYISHKLDELFQIADHLIALKDGKVTGSRSMTGITEDEIIRMIVGRELDQFKRDHTREVGEELLRIENWFIKHGDRVQDFAVKDIHFTLYKGEILGIFGLMGAGRTELLESLFGLHPKQSSGKIYMHQKEISIKTPSDAIQNGIAFVTEDRKKQGLVLQMSVSENISLANVEENERWGFISEKLETVQALKYIQQLRIKTPDEKQLVRNLSGGNQQKVVLAKWLAKHPKVLLLDEPTRGIDVQAKNEIYRLIMELASEGIGILLVSSELPEILSLSNRILVLAESELTGSFTYAEASEEKIMERAVLKS